jgi:hypothetical protein
MEEGGDCAVEPAWPAGEEIAAATGADIGDATTALAAGGGHDEICDVLRLEQSVVAGAVAVAVGAQAGMASTLR